MNETYEIVKDKYQAMGIKCLKCGLTSWNPNDVINLYCGACHVYHEQPDQLHGSYHD